MGLVNDNAQHAPCKGPVPKDMKFEGVRLEHLWGDKDDAVLPTHNVLSSVNKQNGMA